MKKAVSCLKQKIEVLCPNVSMHCLVLDKKWLDVDTKFYIHIYFILNINKILFLSIMISMFNTNPNKKKIQIWMREFFY